MILEVLEPRTGEVRHRFRLDGLPLALGRGYANDVILDDPYVDARHARITQDDTGQLILEDLGSVNGLVALGSGERVPRVVVRPGVELRVGRTTLRFRDPDEPVPPALPDAPGQPPVTPLALRWVTNARGRLAVSAAALGVIAGYTWLSSFERSSSSAVFAGALAFLLLAAVWAGNWAVASRIVVHRFHFLEHFAVASAATLVAVAYTVISEWTTFVFPDNPVLEPMEDVAGIVLLTALIAGHLALSSTLTRARRWRAGLITGLVVAAIGGAARLTFRDDSSDVPRFAGVIKPFPIQWLPAGTVEGFGDVAADLKEQVDDLVSEN